MFQLFVLGVFPLHFEENVHAPDPGWKLQCDFHDWKSTSRHFQYPDLNSNNCALNFLDIYNIASQVELWIFDFAHFVFESVQDKTKTKQWYKYSSF